MGFNDAPGAKRSDNVERDHDMANASDFKRSRAAEWRAESTDKSHARDTEAEVLEEGAGIVHDLQSVAYKLSKEDVQQLKNILERTKASLG